MRIALIHADLPNESKGGVAHVVHHLGNHLVTRGHDVTMFTYSPRFDECLYKVHQLNEGKRSRRTQSFTFAFHLRSVDFSGFDVINAHGDNYWLRGRHPQVRTFHGSAKDELQSALSAQRKLKQFALVYLETLGARVADLSTGVSKSTQARVPSVTHIIPNGVDLESFGPGEKSPHPTILFVGTTGGRKRGAWLNQIFQEQVRPLYPNAELWSVADAPLDGPGIKNWGRVSFDQLTDLYRRAWIFCLPSTYEGFGVPYIEAMASGTAVVASPNLGAREVLQEGAFGAIAEDDALGSTLSDLLMHDARREDLACRGLKQAQEYGWSRIVSQYEQAYDEAIQIHKSRVNKSR